MLRSGSAYISICLALSACSEPEIEDRITIYDSYERAYYKSVLESEDIPFRETKAGDFWISIRYRDSEKRAREKAHQRFYGKCGFVLYQEDARNHFKRSLENLAVPYEELQTDDGVRIICDDSFYEAVKPYFYEAMFDE